MLLEEIKANLSSDEDGSSDESEEGKKRSTERVDWASNSGGKLDDKGS